MDLPRKRKQAREVDESAMVNLPSHILMEIISRLPIKTVMAIRCVSKSLLNLVSDTTFQEMYSTTAPTELLLRHGMKHHGSDDHGYKPFLDFTTSTTLYIAEPVFLSDVVDMKINVMFDLPRFSVNAKNAHFRATRNNLTLVNVCNGLVCYIGPSTNRFAVIINPITGEYVTIPGPDRKDKTVEGKDTSYGFGFSPKDNKFKLLRLLWRDSGGRGPVTWEKRISMVCEIYTFDERGSWKSVADCPNVYPPRDAAFREGVLHWYWADSVVTFDFDSDQFGRCYSPPRLSSSRMGVLGGCLYIAGCKSDSVVETRVMKEYGLDSWTNLFAFRRGGPCREYCEPIKYLPNGEILILSDLDNVARYNPDTRRVTAIGSVVAGCEAILIRPSLVPLKVVLGERCVHKNHTKVAKIPYWWRSSVRSREMGKTCGDKGKEMVKPITQELQASQAGNSKSLEALVSTPIPVQSQEGSKEIRKTRGDKGKEMVPPITKELQAPKSGSSKSLKASVPTAIPVQSQVSMKKKPVEVVALSRSDDPDTPTPLTYDQKYQMMLDVYSDIPEKLLKGTVVPGCGGSSEIRPPTENCQALQAEIQRLKTMVQASEEARERDRQLMEVRLAAETGALKEQMQWLLEQMRKQNPNLPSYPSPGQGKL